MGNERARLQFTDPPYNVPIDGHVSGLGEVRHEDFAMACGEMTEAEFTAFLTAVLSLGAKYSVDGALHYVCMDWRHLLELVNAVCSPERNPRLRAPEALRAAALAGWQPPGPNGYDRSHGL